MTWLDPRFRRAVDCVIELGHKAQDRSECEAYARPMLLVHALLLALGVLAIARAAETIFDNRALFWLSGVLATVALVPDADLFAFVMTESLTFCLYGMAALAMVQALKRPGIGNTIATGVLFGLLCLTRASFLALVPVVVVLIAINGRWIAKTAWRAIATQCLVFAVAFAAVVVPWIVRNGVSAGKWAMSEEYGSAAIIERFAYDDMTWREYLLAFPYCLPEIGEPIVDRSVRAAGDGTLRLLRAAELLPCRPRPSRSAQGGARPPRSADRRPGPRRDARAWLVVPRRGHPARLVRHVGRRLSRAAAGADVRVGRGRGGAPRQAAVRCSTRCRRS